MRNFKSLERFVCQLQAREVFVSKAVWREKQGLHAEKIPVSCT